jgi:hypothetical protein
MSEDLTTLEVKQASAKVRPVLVVELILYATIIALVLGMVYTLFLNAAFTAHQYQIEKHITAFLGSDARKQEVTVNFLFFNKSILLSREGGTINVDLGSDDDFNKHCFDTNLKLLAGKEQKVKIFFDEINSRCAEHEGNSVFSIGLISSLPSEE